MKKYLIIAMATLVMFGCSSDDKHSWKTGDKCDVSKMAYLNGTECQDEKLVTCVNSHAEVRKCMQSCTVSNDNVAMCAENIPTAGSSANAQAGCGDVGAEGKCNGSVLRYCNSGKIVETDCASNNQICGMNRGRFYDCIDSNVARPTGSSQQSQQQQTTTECGSITEKGICDGTVALLCIKNSLASIDCKTLGRTCGLDASGKVDCVETNSSSNNIVNKPAEPSREEDSESQQNPSGCGKITAQGACSGDVLRTCVDNDIKTENCSALGLSCGYDNSVGRYNCIKPVTDSGESKCGKITDAGTCDGAVLKFCDNNKLVTYDCKQRDMTCGKTSNGEFACVSQASAEDPGNYVAGADCGDITDDGICDGNFSVWCDNGKIVKDACDNGCVVDGDGYAVCRVPCGNINSNGICEGSELKYCMNDTLTTVSCEDTKCVSVSSGYSQCYAPCDEGMKAGDSVCEEDSQVACFDDLGLTVVTCVNGCIEGEDDMGKFGVCKP